MTKSGKWARRAVWSTLLAVLTIGCNPLTTIGFLLHKDTVLPAEYPLRPKEGPKKDKDEEISVLVLCGQRYGGGVPDEFVRADRDLALAIAKRMPEEAKMNKEKISVISPTQLDKFKMSNPSWSSMPASKIGKSLNADYVIDITLTNLQVYQPASRNMLYEGRAEVFVDVYEVSAGPGEPKHKYAHQFVYRPNQTPDATDIPISRYKQGFIERLALEISWKHLDHKPADGIANEQR